ncbi:hypothetical protein P3T20_001214 [Paraburkholderia sp. GAS206C]|jgi:hypothetical protein|uniref:hypothetical protein n=1 Tax=unclassified Paraburkholderia TaxID=2615204 RepID=UPI003D2024E5
MKQIISRTVIAAAFLVSTSVFAGTTSARPVTEFELMDAGLGPVDIITPANAVSGEDRHLQSLAVSVRDEEGNVVAGVTCTLSNDQGSWSVRGGETVAIRRSTSELRATCTKDDHVIASAVVPSAQTRVRVATGPFGGGVIANLPAYPVALDFAPANTAAAAAASPLAQH